MKLLRKLITIYPLTMLISIAIWVLCLIPIPETPLGNVTMIDKWTHIVMFLTTTLVLFLEHVRHEKKYGKHALELRRSALKFLFVCFVYSSLTGGLIELAQAHLTNGVRSGDFMDFVADALGAAVGVAIGIPLARWFSRA